jgi:hypothetical protein
MDFRIADTFTDALARLPASDQKAVKTSAFDLQMNPQHPSLVKLLAGPETSVIPRIRVASLSGVAAELLELATGRRAHVARDDQIARALEKAAADAGLSAKLNFLRSEWAHVVDAWQVADLADYLAVPRLGRDRRLGSKQREKFWPVFAAARADLESRGFFTWPGVFSAATRHFADKSLKPFSHIVIDEAQDLGVPELRFLAAIAPAGENSLFFSGDLGQRIFQQPFSWKALGVDIRGRAATLKVNYRTSHQIRRAADRLLPGPLRDVDGVVEERKGTVSVFNGPEPKIVAAEDEAAETRAVAAFIKAALSDGVAPREIGVFARTPEQLARARAAVQAAGAEALELSERGDDPGARVSMHDAPRQRARIQGGRRHRLRRGRPPAALPHRLGGGRGGARRGLRHRAAAALRRRHPRPRPAHRHRRQAGVGVLEGHGRAPQHSTKLTAKPSGTRPAT